MPSTRPAMTASLASPSAAARCLDRDGVAGDEVAGHLGGQRLPVQQVPSRRTGRAAPLALRCVRASLADDREPDALEHAGLADNAFAAAVLSAAARALAQPVAL